MKRYEHFSEENFINDPDFQKWVLQPDEENDAYWDAFLKQFPHQKPVIDRAAKRLLELTFQEQWPTDEKVEASLNAALKKINEEAQGAKIIRFGKFYKWLLVAAVFFLVVSGTYWFVRQKQNGISPEDKQLALNNDSLLLRSDKVLLILGDKRTVILDIAANGALANQGGVLVMKEDGKLSYKGDKNVDGEVVYNTVSTSRQGLYQVVLADGTKVWLNGSSSLTFPTAFSGADRKVELRGEGYFEVTHNEKQPFYIGVNNTIVKVLGTQFNVNGYADEPVIKTTLLEGRVMVQAGKKFLYLNPGQQGQASISNDFLRLQNNVNPDEVMAWKSGKFDFGEGTDVRAVMRQLARWYGLEVAYNGKVDGNIGGTLPRTADASQALKMLAATGGAKFELKGNKVTVVSSDIK